MNEQTTLAAIQGHKFLSEKIREVGCVVADIRKTTYKHPAKECYTSFDFFDSEPNDVTINLEESTCSCCGSEYYSISFPISYLWTENFAEIETAAHADRVDKAEKAAAAKKKREEDAAQKLREDNELKTYQRLKKKFGKIEGEL